VSEASFPPYVGYTRAEVLAPRISFCEANAVFLAKQNTDDAPCAAFLSNIFGGAKILAGCRARSPAERGFFAGRCPAPHKRNFLKKVSLDSSKTFSRFPHGATLSSDSLQPPPPGEVARASVTERACEEGE